MLELLSLADKSPSVTSEAVRFAKTGQLSRSINATRKQLAHSVFSQSLRLRQIDQLEELTLALFATNSYGEARRSLAASLNIKPIQRQYLIMKVVWCFSRQDRPVSSVDHFITALPDPFLHIVTG